ncbi:hypothetical protein NDU88_002790 [Pleurodeles waltl]|uniref:Uncharacterized protein n=1 Tax=Pleurodeles waltl TaxID=8319 RepID=A0AAV7RDS4_PLEWA|nr:hypothetical protein NDU88_002790 [Pleurodeles waltl]
MTLPLQPLCKLQKKCHAMHLPLLQITKDDRAISPMALLDSALNEWFEPLLFFELSGGAVPLNFSASNEQATDGPSHTSAAENEHTPYRLCKDQTYATHAPNDADMSSDKE